MRCVGCFDNILSTLLQMVAMALSGNCLVRVCLFVCLLKCLHQNVECNPRIKHGFMKEGAPSSNKTLLVPDGYILVQEYEPGSTAALRCTSVDANHTFMFWQSDNDDNVIVGPQSIYDQRYQFDNLTGQLFIQNVTKDDSGLYKCVSQGPAPNALRTRSTELIVEGTWREIFENNTQVNAFRITFIILAMIVVSAALIYTMTRQTIPRHHHHHQPHRKLMESRSNSIESGDDIFTDNVKASTSTNALLEDRDDDDSDHAFRPVYSTLQKPIAK